MTLKKDHILKIIKYAGDRVQEEISSFAFTNHVSAEVVSEGFNGGYREALDDILLLLNGTVPNRHSRWWPSTREEFEEILSIKKKKKERERNET